MSNESIIKRLINACELYTAKKLTATQLETEIQHHALALEKLKGADIQKFRDFESRIVHADLSGEEYPGEDVKKVVSEFKAWLTSLPK